MPCFIWVQDLGHFVCIVGKINNMQLCVKIMLICACVCINMEIGMNGNYM